MTETITLWLTDAESTSSAGRSLASSLYGMPLTIALSGELGAGKTTFLQGFAGALGTREPVTSPTYALEQRYATGQHGELLHIDLYRLESKDAASLLHSSDMHPGIRCIEWPERVQVYEKSSVHIHLSEERHGRRLTIDFNDIPLPSPVQIADWRREVLLQEHIIRHCDAVGGLAEKLAHALLQRNIVARPLAVRRAGEVHDLLRFIDFKPESNQHFPATDEQYRLWGTMKKHYAGLKHEAACTQFLAERGYAALGKIVETHGLLFNFLAPETTEQKILFYADKRVNVDHVVTLDERFTDFRSRYGESPNSDIWLKEARKIESELFPEGVPL